MLCQSCHANPATVHVTEIVHPDPGAPEGTAPEGTAPEGTAPEGTAPEGTAPEGTAPEGTAPEGTAPEGTAPEGTAPEGTAPEVGAASNGAPAGNGTPPGPSIQEQHLCEACAEAAKLPQMPAVLKKSIPELYQLLQASKRSRRESSVACPECGMTLLEFRQRGRLGCPKDYEVFAPHLRELFERIHGATHHTGRAPGLDAEAVQRLQRRSQLQRDLEAAIREEAYEQAARLRDELKDLEPS